MVTGQAMIAPRRQDNRQVVLLQIGMSPNPHSVHALCPSSLPLSSPPASKSTSGQRTWQALLIRGSVSSPQPPALSLDEHRAYVVVSSPKLVSSPKTHVIARHDTKCPLPVNPSVFCHKHIGPVLGSLSSKGRSIRR